MKKLPIRRDLNLQLLIIYLLFFVPVVFTVFYIENKTNQRLENDSKMADLALARAIAQDTNTTLSYALQSVKKLGAYRAVIENDVSAMEPLFSTIMSVRPDINLVYRLDSQGFMQFHYPIGPGSTLGNDFSFREYFQRAQITSRALISKGRISPTTQQPVATAVMPLWDDRANFLGLVGTNIKLESISQSLSMIASEYDPNENFHIMIIDSSGQIIAHPSGEMLLTEVGESLQEVTERVLLGRNGNLIIENQYENEILYSYVPVRSSGWGVIVSRPTEAAFATSHAFRTAVLSGVGIFLVIGGIFWMNLGRQVIRPLETLAGFSQTIGQKNNKREGYRNKIVELSERPDQVGNLAHSLIRMETAIEARLNELATLLQTSAAVISTLDPQIVLERILEQVERLLDVKMSAIVALDANTGLFRAQANRGLSDHYVESLSIHPDEPHSITLRSISSGEPIQISDVETDTSSIALRPSARTEGYRSILSIPLKTQYAPQSALLIFRPDPHTFTNREITLLSNFANHAAMAIENAALYSRSDMQLQEQSRRLEALIQSLKDGLILEDLEGKVIYANRRISELTRLPAEELAGTPVDFLIDRILELTIDPEDKQVEIQSIFDGDDQQIVELSLHLDEKLVHLRLHFFAVMDSQGLPIGHGQILHDITADRELDRMKSSLISTVSHELRTPLAAIKGYASTLLAEDVQWDKSSQREFLTIISKETDRLSALVTDLLDLSRLEAGSLTINRTECDLTELVHRAIKGSQPCPEERINIRIAPEHNTVIADPRRIESVLRNLIENAAKYAGETSPIEISAIKNQDVLVVKVSDQGPGIPAEHQKRIFESFYRLDNGFNRTLPGAGLGLAICQGFIQAHGGNIWVESSKKGACIAFSLPDGFMNEK